jgi:hypothetical protein
MFMLTNSYLPPFVIVGRLVEKHDIHYLQFLIYGPSDRAYFLLFFREHTYAHKRKVEGHVFVC